MKRAAILIGVDKTGDLPRLRDAARGALAMKAWAETQGFDPIHVFTDAQAPVQVKPIKDAIKALVDAGNVGQLLVYFAGHGVNLMRQEYWLLSDAPDDTQAAVNLYTSATLAATCGIGHVVFVSDACRTAPEGIRAQSVRGSEMFPNRESDAAPVDQFFACQLGKPSHEVRDANVTASEFQALYTHELVPALSGAQPQIVQWPEAQTGAERIGHVQMRPLRDHMAAAVAARIAGLNLQTKVMQSPVAQISSDPGAWLAQVRPAPVTRGARSAPPKPPPAVVTPEELTQRMLEAAFLAGTTLLSRGGVAAGSPAPSPVEPAMQDEVRLRSKPFGPTTHETRCGFKLRGALAADAVARNAQVSFVTGAPRGSDLRVDLPQGPANVLLVMPSGSGALLPALPEFLCALTFDEDDGELIDVAYEPAEGTWRWDEFRARAESLRELRAVASTAMAHGSFKLEGRDALEIARRMQLAKGVDPALALYAGYAYHDLQRRDLIEQMSGYLRGDLGAPFFDVALLARKLDGRSVGSDAPAVLGAVPLLAQGWALMRAFGVRLAPALAPLENLRTSSLWTMFDARGVALLREAITQGAIP